MVSTYWPSTCVFNELYLEKILALLRHTFPITTFSRVDIYWLVLPWDHDQSTASVLVGYGRGRVCNLGRTLTKYFRKRQIGITALWMHHGDVIKWKLFFPLLASCEGIHRSPVDSPHGDQWRRALLFCLICVINKRLSKQSRRRWFETPSRSWWRHCIDLRKINMSVWSKRNAFSKGRLWSQLIDRLRACSISCILKIYLLLYATLFQ